MRTWLQYCAGILISNLFSGALSDFDNGVWIVHLDPECTHDEFHQHVRNVQVSKSIKAEALHSYYNVIHGVAVRDVHEDELRAIPCVKHFVKDSVKHLVGVPSWGQDRVDQENLPLDDSYVSYFSGQGVNVYILDTGIDTNHNEFNGGDFTREVKNIYSAFASKKKTHDPGSDTDGHGHGTHCAGTVGGKTVGLAKGVNIYGLKILGDNGEGSTADILAAMEVVHQHALASGRPSLASMSLGGDCEKPTDCASDSLVMGVESLYRAGIVTSVASGNSGCNGCNGSPNAAPNAVNVGATGITDFVTYFSNYGQCIDIFAPGFNIISAAAKSTSGNERQYAMMSGTSMACPHVAGVLALNLQKYSTGSTSHPTPDLVTKAMRCDAARNVLHMDSMDTLSRNLLLQIPKQGAGGVEECNLGAGCQSSCSGHGMCLPERLVESEAPREAMSCYCDAGYYGSSCASTSQECKGNSHHITLALTDAFGDGWSFGSFSITDAAGNIVDGAYDSLCDGYEDNKKYCLKEDTYTFRVESGMFPDENQWSMCGIEGGAPYIGDFVVNPRYSHGCQFTCDGRPLTTLVMKDSYGDGWNGAYYNLFSPDRGALLYGGSLEDGKSGVHHICLPSGCSVMMMGAVGSEPSEVSDETCGFEGNADDYVNICVDEATGACSVSLLDLDVDPGCDASIDHSGVDMMLFHFGVSDSFSDEPFAEGAITVTITDPEDSNAVVSRTELADQFKGVYDVCLRDGCYDVDIRTSSSEGNIVDAIWVICGVRGEAPWSARMCVNKEYNLCYGISNCPAIVSYAHTSDLNQFLVYHDSKDDDGGPSNEVSHYGNVHGATDLCGLSVGHHSVYIGAGRYGGSDDRRNEVHLCGQQLTIPVSASMNVISNGTDCTLSNIHHPQCTESHDMVLLDAYGDGWGPTGKYTIRVGGVLGPVLHTGSLRYGQVRVENLCLESNKCYWLDVSAEEFEDEILWIMCGYMGDAPSSMEFCTDGTNTCRFTWVDDDGYEREEDDDFIDINEDLTTFPTVAPSTTAPTRKPTLAPSREEGVPTDMPTSSPVSPTASPVVSFPPTNLPTFAETHTPTTTPTMAATNYSQRDTHPHFGIPIEAFVFHNVLEVRMKVAVGAGRALEDVVLNHTSLMFMVEAVRKVVFNLGLDAWKVKITDCTVTSVKAKPPGIPVPTKDTESNVEGVFMPGNPFYQAGDVRCSLELEVVPDPYAWLDLYSLKSRLTVGMRTAVLTGHMDKYLKHACFQQNIEFPLTSMVDEAVLSDARVMPGQSMLQPFFPWTYRDPESEYTKAFHSFVTAGPEQTQHSTATKTTKEIEQTRLEVFVVTLVFTVCGMLIAYCIFLLYYCRVKVAKAVSGPVNMGGAYAKVHSNRTNRRQFEILDDDEEDEVDDDIDEYVAESTSSRTMMYKIEKEDDADSVEDEEASVDVGAGTRLPESVPPAGNSRPEESGSERDSGSERELSNRLRPRGASALQEVSSMLTDALGAEDDMNSTDEQTY